MKGEVFYPVFLVPLVINLFYYLGLISGQIGFLVILVLATFPLLTRSKIFQQMQFASLYSVPWVSFFVPILPVVIIRLTNAAGASNITVPSFWTGFLLFSLAAWLPLIIGFMLVLLSEATKWAIPHKNMAF